MIADASRLVQARYWGATTSAFRDEAIFQSDALATSDPGQVDGIDRRGIIQDMDDYEVVAEELSQLAETMRGFEERLAEVERVNARLEDAALSTARALGEVSRHWNAVYEAMRRVEGADAESSSVERDHAASRARVARSAPRSRTKPQTSEGPAQAEPSIRIAVVELRGGDAVAVSHDVAARDLRLVRDDRVELLVADP